MLNEQTVTAVIPALNEERSLPRVLAAIPPWVDDVIVVDNGSTDGTVSAAERGGARVVSEPRRGYGAACLAGIAAARDADILVFLDADFSDYPQQMDRLVMPIATREADFVIGSRTLGRREAGSLTVVQRWGNRLSCFLIRWIWGGNYTDLGPFRAIRNSALRLLHMDDRTYGWTIQMQIRAIQAGLRVLEAPVDYRRRIGQSKISGTIRGVFAAGAKILATVLRERLRRARVTPYVLRPDHLIVFTRYPEPGKTKTRLIPALGAEGAANLHRDMTAQTLQTVDQVRFARGVSAEVRHAGGSLGSMVATFGDGHTFLPQGDGDLGKRMHRAACDAFSRGVERLIVIGADCPSLDAATVSEAFESLRNYDCVIGPASDGGYYLIGLRRPCRELFDGIDWGTERVLAATIQRASEANLAVHQLETKQDVDVPGDLPEWERHRRPLTSAIVSSTEDVRTANAIGVSA